MYVYPGKPTPPRSLSIHPGMSTSSRRAFGSVLHTLPASHISPSSWATTSYELSILVASKGAPRKSSNTSTIRWRNSKTKSGSTSREVVDRNSRLD